MSALESSARLTRFSDWQSARAGAIPGSGDGLPSFFAGVHAYARMDLVREAINEIRSEWHRYPAFMSELRDLVALSGVDLTSGATNTRFRRVLSSQKSWARSSTPDASDDYDVIRLYASASGYRQIFQTINTAFRSAALVHDPGHLRAATFLIELLNIDLYNYRSRTPEADDFQGTVYRGMCVRTEELDALRRVAVGPISERYVSVPLAMVSASTELEPAIAFARERANANPETTAVLWEIHIASLDQRLLDLYRAQFPESIVTSLCAVPISRLSDFEPEKEVLLRGPHFQILGVSSERAMDGVGVDCKIEAIALNSNRDHLSAIASNQGIDRDMRDLFRALIVCYRSTLCAEYCDRRGANDDADAYRELVQTQNAVVNLYR
jgi:hypothetical protein